MGAICGLAYVARPAFQVLPGCKQLNNSSWSLPLSLTAYIQRKTLHKESLMLWVSSYGHEGCIPTLEAQLLSERPLSSKSSNTEDRKTTQNRHTPASVFSHLW